MTLEHPCMKCTPAENHEHQRKRILNGEIIVDLAWLENDSTGVSSAIFINAPAEAVWKAISDYDNLDITLPKVVSSHIIKREGSTVTIDQIGKTGILIFERSVHFVLEAREEYLQRIEFHQVEGDFETYRGEWVIESMEADSGCILHYCATIKPAFFAPAVLVSFVQRQDLPGIMKAHKHRAEELHHG